MKTTLVALAALSMAGLEWLSREQALDPALLQRARQECQAQRGKLQNRRYVSIVDYRQNILQKRLYVYDLVAERVVLQARVAHAFRSGVLYPTKFSNAEGSEQSSYGSFVTAQPYHGKFGYSMRLDGISTTNTHARARAIVVHAGRTYTAACFATAPAVNERLINLTQGKSLLVVYK